MPGIYLHIPFCKQACYYCNFHFSTSLRQKEEMIAALLKEINNPWQPCINPIKEKYKIETIYFGGGTPSILTGNEIKKLSGAIFKSYDVCKNAEITLEANPDDITENKLADWKLAGINRLSVGIQSFNNEELSWMNRVHNTEQSFHCIEVIKKSGFTNFSADLIYGTPLLSDLEWKKNVDTMLCLGVPHISCYALTVEPATALHKMIGLKKKSDVDPEKQARQFLLLMEWMKAAGYEHYEISNFALPGYRSRHNSSYWQHKSYIGIGPSAHSFYGNKRKWNVSNNALYIQSLAQNNLLFEEETLSVTQQLNEYIMTSLRTIEGLDLNYVKENFGEEACHTLQVAGRKYVINSTIKENNNYFILTDNGKLFADGIAADLFFAEEELHHSVDVGE